MKEIFCNLAIHHSYLTQVPSSDTTENYSFLTEIFIPVTTLTAAHFAVFFCAQETPSFKFLYA